jgi:alkylhydroperoxidase family enzyme
MRLSMPDQSPGYVMPQFAKAYSSPIVEASIAYCKQTYQHSTLSLREFEAGRYRTAQINGCTICIDFRAGAQLPSYFDSFGGDIGKSVHANGPAPDEAFYQNVENWRDHPGYSERERLVIAYAEGMGCNPHDIAYDEEFWSRAKLAFTDQEIVDLSFCIACWMGVGRANHAMGLDGACAVPPQKIAA